MPIEPQEMTRELALDHEELLNLRQFLYQSPVGLLEVSDAGAVRMVNPAAVSLLAPVIGAGDLTQLFPLLAVIAPDMISVISGEPGRMGPLARGRWMLVSGGPHAEACLEMQAVRVAPGRVMIVVQDVSAERRLAQREHEIAVELQLAMLGHADEVPGLTIGVTYRAAEAELQVGGDWYDVISLPGGRAGLIVGDVVGHTLSATTAMGQLRSAIRATARHCSWPGALLQETDALAGQISGAPFSTMAYALVDLATGDLSYATAGHPPVLLVRADGTARYLTGGRGLPLTLADTGRSTATARLAPGDIVIMYTDGLYERRRPGPEDSLAALADLAAASHRLPPTELSQALTDGMLAGEPAQDDICVLVAAMALSAS